MPEYSFLTTWCLEAPREPVWDAIWDSEKWPQWWRGVTAAEKLADGDEDGVGQVGRYSWRSKLPYDLDFTMTTTRVEPPYLLEGEASGELAGTGRWRLFRGRLEARDGGCLRVERAHHEALDERDRAARGARLRLESRLGDAQRRRGPREATRLPSPGRQLI